MFATVVQDCHELMHALSETLDEETCPPPKVLSLFDVTALQVRGMCTQTRGTLKTRQVQKEPNSMAEFVETPSRQGTGQTEGAV